MSDASRYKSKQGEYYNIAKLERELTMRYKMRATNQAMLQAMKGLVDAE